MAAQAGARDAERKFEHTFSERGYFRGRAPLKPEPRASRAPEDVGPDEYLRAIVKAYREYLREHGLLDWYLRQDDRAGYPVPLAKLIRRIKDPRIRALPLGKHAELCRRLSRRDAQSRFQYSYFPLAEDEENKHLVSIRPSLVKEIGESEEDDEEETPKAEATAEAPGSRGAAPRRWVYVWLGEDGIVHTGKSHPRNVKQYVVVERTAKGVAVEVAIPGIRVRLRLDDPARIKEFEDAVYNVVGQLVDWTTAHAVLDLLRKMLEEGSTDISPEDYFAALKRAWKRYWKNVPPWYASVERISKYIDEELCVVLGREAHLSLDEHLRYIRELSRRGKIEYWYGGMDPKRRHWIRLREEGGRA